MFTGIVEEVGEVSSLETSGDGRRIEIFAEKILDDAELGSSIAINGCCLTVVEIHKNSFVVETVPETLSRTSLGALKKGDLVNMERALSANGRFGGHIVQGHVNKKTNIKKIEKYGKNYLLTMALSPEIAPYLVQEGSVAVEGISLTISNLNDEARTFTVSVIPHTWDNTVLKNRKLGHEVNIEVDIFAKYIERLLVFKHKENSTDGRVPLTMDWLKSKGF